MEDQEILPNPPWETWPHCPQCDARRQCICPICQTAGTHFPLADFQATPAPLLPLPGPPAEEPRDTRPLLYCPTCDEVFPPRFYERCHACGYDFHEGIHLDQHAADGLASRIRLAALCVLATGTLLFVYFWWLLRG